MNQTKLFRFLRAFSIEEIRDLALFAQSPLFNDGERPLKVLALLEYMGQYFGKAPETNLAKEAVYRQLFEGDPFSENKMDKLLSEAIKVVRKFVAVCCSEALTDETYWHSQAVFFRRHGLDTEFGHAIGKATGLQQSVPFKEHDYYSRQFLLESEQVKHLVRKNDNKSDINLSRTIQHLDVFYLITKMEYCSYLLTQGKVTRINADHSFAMLEEVLQTAKDHYLSVPIVAAYYHALSLLLNQETQDEHYQYLKKVLQENAQQLSFGTLKALHSFMRNFISRRYNQGENDCLGELFALYKSHAEMGTIYQEEGYIPSSTLMSAVTVALKCGEIAWATDFLQRHRHLIAGADEPEAIYFFNLANCYFYMGEYEKSSDILVHYQFKDAFYKLAARRLEIKLYYETSSPILHDKLDAFKIFVHQLKTSLPPDKIVPNNHFIDLMRQILAPKTLHNEERVNKLRKKLLSLKAVAEREWLTRQLELLLGK